MRRCQLEMCIDILEVLDHRGPLKPMHVMNETNVNSSKLKECLEFLTKQGLVEVKSIRKERKVYAITQLGVSVLKQFRELKEAFPSVEETGNEAGTRELFCSKEQILLT
jgi:predicted transcriptional regulator